MTVTNVAAVQFEAGPDTTLKENVDRAMDVVESLDDDVDLACLPEYFSTPYFPAIQDEAAFDLAVADDDPLVDTIRETAAETKTAIIAPLFERGYPGGRYFNTAFVIDDRGSLVGRYRKLHPFQRPGYNEEFYFSPGDLGAPVFEVAGLRIGIMICYDRHFPEIARVQALRGADVVFVPTCSFGEENRDAVWTSELTGIAVSNSVFVIGVNRAGTEDGQSHFGTSVAIDPTGREIDALGAHPGVLTAAIDPDRVSIVRNKTKHLNDMRDELLPQLDRL
jgi:predicted amidohydrolase